MSAELSFVTSEFRFSLDAIKFTFRGLQYVGGRIEGPHVTINLCPTSLLMLYGHLLTSTEPSGRCG